MIGNLMFSKDYNSETFIIWETPRPQYYLAFEMEKKEILSGVQIMGNRKYQECPFCVWKSMVARREMTRHFSFELLLRTSEVRLEAVEVIRWQMSGSWNVWRES
jgi:hypothetical protein